jgi:hypothetical protein
VPGPAVAALITTDAWPAALVVATGVTTPEVVEKLMTLPACGAPAILYSTVTTWLELTGIAVPGAGDTNANCDELTWIGVVAGTAAAEHQESVPALVAA